MGERRIDTVYEEFVVAPGLERVPLLKQVRARFTGSPTVLYPGCFGHVTPSFFFQHVVYVDRAEFAQEFFARTDEVLALIDRRRAYRQSPYFRFLAEDFTKTLPIRDASFDLLLALYAGGISRACSRYVKPGGLILSNNHHGDADDASGVPDLELAAVLNERRGRVTVKETELTGYLQSMAGRESGRSRVRSTKREPNADYYLFRKI
jgi:hypothetical protein